MRCEKRPRSEREIREYWKNIETTIPLSPDLRELTRADLRDHWHYERLEISRREVKTNWSTDDTYRLILKDETGMVTLKQLQLFCNKATAVYYMRTAQGDGRDKVNVLTPHMIYAMIAREWLHYHNFRPNIEFQHYIAHLVRIVPGGLTDIFGIIQAHRSLSRQSSELLSTVRERRLDTWSFTSSLFDNFDIHPL